MAQTLGAFMFGVFEFRLGQHTITIRIQSRKHVNFRKD